MDLMWGKNQMNNKNENKIIIKRIEKVEDNKNLKINEKHISQASFPVRATPLFPLRPKKKKKKNDKS